MHADNWSVAPFWWVPREEPPVVLAQDLQCDVLIIGAGVTGLSVAYNLCDRHKVIVVDAGQIGEGSTGWSAGILSLSTTLDFSTVEASVGEEQARSLAFFLSEGILKARAASGLSGDDWQSGSSIYFAAKKSHTKLLLEEYNLRHKYGLPCEYLEGPHLKFWRGFPAVLDLPGEHAAHPIRLLLGMVATVQKSGGKIYEQTAVRGWQHDGEHFVVECGDHQIRAQHMIVCTGTSSGVWPEMKEVERLNVPVTGLIVVTERSPDFLEFVKNTKRIAAWDSLQLYHYIRYFADGRLLIGGEEAPGTCTNTALALDDPQVKSLHAWAQSHHAKKIPPIKYAWKAGLAIPADGLPILKLKTYDESILLGLVTDGLPFAFSLGSIAASLIETGEHPIAKLLSHRRPVPAPARMLSMLSLDPLRGAALEAAFAAMRLKDRLF